MLLYLFAKMYDSEKKIFNIGKEWITEWIALTANVSEHVVKSDISVTGDFGVTAANVIL